MIVLDEFALAVEIEALEEQTEAGKDENFVAIQTEGEAHSSLVQQLYDLNNMLACIRKYDNGRRRLDSQA